MKQDSSVLVLMLLQTRPALLGLKVSLPPVGLGLWWENPREAEAEVEQNSMPTVFVEHALFLHPASDSILTRLPHAEPI